VIQHRLPSFLSAVAWPGYRSLFSPKVVTQG
jgi:hypothetical protein